jgi:L-threonylcarbamoyladenylate synthase
MKAKQLPPSISRQVKKGVTILKKGGVIAFPTDTVYGLGAAVYKHEAVERIFVLKKRSKDMALPLLVSDMSYLDELSDSPKSLAWRLTTRFWPGGLTLVLPSSSKVPKFIGGGKTVALRIPDDEVILALIRGLGQPIVGTSANLSGQPPARTAAEVRRCFGDKIDLIIDGGVRLGGHESTIVDLSSDKPKILREGIIARSEIEDICPVE